MGGDFQCRPGRSDGHDGRSQALGNHHGVEYVIGPVDTAQDVLLGHLNVIKNKTGSSPAPAAHEVV